jgi:hypothetical protein
VARAQSRTIWQKIFIDLESNPRAVSRVRAPCAVATARPAVGMAREHAHPGAGLPTGRASNSPSESAIRAVRRSCSLMALA